jgi:hypothetical protein
LQTVVEAQQIVSEKTAEIAAPIPFKHGNNIK